MSYIFCAESASIPIKSYSPDLMVNPFLPETNEKDKYKYI